MDFVYNVDPFRVVEQGIAIFPVGTDKRPLVSWSKEATTDPAQIQRWLSEFPECRWGAPTGDINGFIAIDIDSEEADDWWSEQFFPLGSDVTTPRGGRHIRFAVDPGMDIQTNVGVVRAGIDIRADGGYVVVYSEDFSDFPELPEVVSELLPRRTAREARIADAVEEYVAPVAGGEMTEAERRVLKGITDRLDALPRPWREGAMYHDTQFRAACHLHRIANSPHYVTDETSAYALFVEHAPLRDKNDHILRDERWVSAKKAVAGNVAEPPGDVPIRLDVTPDLLDRFLTAEIEDLYFKSSKIGDVKKLVHALRMKGATKQEAYSISYSCAAMRKIRETTPESSSTWGYVTKEYDTEVAPKDEGFDAWDAKPKKITSEIPVRLLDDAERAIVRNYPNFIDQYIDSATLLYTNPNMPLHYVNAWISLSVSIGDKASIYEQKGRQPLSLWGLNLAPSASGKSDANAHMRAAVDAIRSGGYASVDLGNDASAQQLTEVVMDRPGEATGLFMDECREFLTASKQQGSYHSQTMNTCLGLYDGVAARALRKGMDKDKIGETSKVSFTLWMQGVWERVIEIMDAGDIESGFVGRFLVAVGEGAKITRESLTPRIASEWQVENDGRHPIIDSFCAPVKYLTTDISNATINFASDEVLHRYVDARKALDEYCDAHELGEQLKGVALRVGLNVLKGAALIALSNGRTIIEMPDLLVAVKSCEHWMKSSVQLSEAISASAYRRHIDFLVRLVQTRHRTSAAIYSHTRFQNMKKYDVDEIIARAEQEGKIRLNNNRVWEAVEND